MELTNRFSLKYKEVTAMANEEKLEAEGHIIIQKGRKNAHIC